jgi:hypothetical protein
VGLFRSRRAKLERALTTSMRLLLPTAPGPDQMLAAARLFNPAAKQIDGNRIVADAEQHVILGPAFEIDPDLGRAAQLPPDITVAYFVHIISSVPLPARPNEALTDRYQAKKRQAITATQAQAKCLISGLATRFGGIAYPIPQKADEPLHADVYTAQEPDEEELAALVSRYVPGLAPVETEWSGRGVITLRGNGSLFDVEYWPPPVVQVPLTEYAADGSDPFTVVTQVIKPSGRGLHALIVRAATAQPARGADPDLARALGRAALGLAADTDGVCMDVFGFRVQRPDDLVVRLPPAGST